jgi:hypothetical protein
MRLSVAYWLRVHNDTFIRIDLSIFNLDQPSAEPILRLTRIVPQVSAGQLLAEYFIHVTTSVCSGQPSHIILFHYHLQSLQIPNHLFPLLTPSRRFLLPQINITLGETSDSDTAFSSPESLYPISPDSPYSLITHSSTTSLSS